MRLTGSVQPACPSPEGPLTMALGRLAPDTMWLADPDGAGDTQAVASVTQVQGHRAPPSAIEAQCGMLHLLGGAAVYLCKDSPALCCISGPLPAPLPLLRRLPHQAAELGIPLPVPRTACPTVKAP